MMNVSGSALAFLLAIRFAGEGAEAGPVCDIGTVLWGEVVTRTFEDEGGPIELRIETSRLLAGDIDKYADVSTNDWRHPCRRVHIRGTIIRPLMVEPRSPRVECIRGKRPLFPIEQVLVKNVPGEVKVLRAWCPSGRFRVDLREIEPGVRWKLVIEMNEGFPSWDNHTDTILIEIEYQGRRHVMEDGIAVLVKDRIDLTPRVASFRKADFDALREESRPAIRTIDVKAFLPPVKITSLELDASSHWFTARIEPVVEGREYRLTVTVDRMPALAAGQRSTKGTILLRTDDPEMAEISIRCLAFF